MSFLVLGGERFAVEKGETVLGGSGAGALDAAALAPLRPFAVITYPIEGPCTIRGLGDASATLNGLPLRPQEDVLQHGDRIAAGGLDMAYGEIRAAGRTSPAAGVTEETPLTGLAHGSPEATAATGGRIVRLSDRSVHAIPDSGLTIGREPTCGLALMSKDVSRTHATIAPSLLGYTLTDQSANGLSVNGKPLDGSCILGQHDVIRIGSEDLRFEADAASFEPSATSSPNPTSEPTPAERDSQDGPLPPPAPWLAAIEVVSPGPLKGMRFRVTRPTVELGRGSQNDVQLNDESVSGRHASLVQRGNRWTIFDLQSRNGTFVEGEIVRDQRELPSVCELRLGTLQLLFRSINVADTGTAGTIGVIGIRDDQLRQS